MLQTKNFQKSMEKKGLWDVVKPFVEKSSSNISGEESMTLFVKLIDENLSVETRMSVMEEFGCCKSPTYQAPFKAFYKKYADKTLKERFQLMSEINSAHKAPAVLNNDGTLSVFWTCGEENNYTCVCDCKMMKEVKSSGITSVSPTFCACCGGNVKALMQTALGVKLRLKSVVSSAVSSGGKERCELLFDIIENKDC